MKTKEPIIMDTKTVLSIAQCDICESLTVGVNGHIVMDEVSCDMEYDPVELIRHVLGALDIRFIEEEGTPSCDCVDEEDEDERY